MLEDTRLIGSIENLLVHDHLCLIYENQKEQFDAVIPFIRIGLDRGEKCIYIADDNTAGQVLNAMRADGIDVESALNKGALVIATKKETYLKQGYFDPDEMIRFLKVATDSAKKDGFPALRVTGEMTWVLGKDPGSMRLMEYESKLNLFFPGNDCLAICQYNKNRFDPEIIKSVINTHPLVIVGGFVCRNFYYIPPEEFLKEEKGSLEVERLLSNLIDREKAEEKIKEAQKVLDRQYAEKSEIFNAIGQMTLLLDPKHNILAANRAAVTGLGKTEEELRGKKCYEFLHGTSQPPESCPMEKMLLSNCMETSEMVVETLNGTYLVSCTPLFDENGNLEKVIHITTDITERKRAEEALEESQSRFKSIYQQSPLAIELYDPKGLLIDANPKCLETFGVNDIRKIIGFKLFDDPNISDELKRKIGCGEVVTFESEFDFDIVKKKRLYETSRSGRIYIECTVSPWEIADAAQGYLVHVVDITQRKLAEMSLRESESRLRSISNNITAGMIYQVVIKPDGTRKFTYLSDSVQQLYGITPEEGIADATLIYSRVHEDDIKLLTKIEDEAVRTVSTFKAEVRMKDPSGETRWSSFVSTSRRMEDGSICFDGIEFIITDRKRAEVALRESEEKYRTIVETANEGIWMLDADSKTSYVNSRMAQILGYASEEMLGKYLLDFMDADARIDAQKYLQRRKEGIKEDHDFRFSRKDGTDLWTIISTSPVFDDKGHYAGALGMVTDISQRKQAEEALRKAEENIRTIYNSITGHLTVVDRNYRIVNYNLTVERQFGKDLMGKVCYEAYQARKEICPDCAVKKTLGTGKPAFTFQPATPISNPVDIYTYPIFDEKGEIVAVIEHGIEVTERVKAEQALQISEEKFLKAFRSSPIALTLAKVEDGVLVEANQAFEDITGYPVAAAIGKTAHELDLFPDPNERPIEALKDKKQMRNVEMHLRRKSGETRTVQCSAELITIGNLEYIISTTEDITERKKAEEQIRYQAAVLANVNDAIVASDENYKLTAWNTAAESLYGWKAEEVLGRSGLEIMQTDYPGEDKNNMLNAIKTRGMWRGEITQVRKDGKRIPVEVSSIVLLDEKGRITGYISVNRDITQRKQIEEELKKYREHLEELVKERTVELNQKNEELEKFNRLFVGRELRMIELKKKIEELEKKDRGT